MPFNLTTFKSAGLPQGGYRPTLFEVDIARLGQRFSLLAQSAQVPALTMGMIDVPYFGRKIKLAGDRTYAEWTCTVMMDEDFNARAELENWNLQMNSEETNLRELIAEGYKEDLEVKLYGKQGSVLRTYKLIGAWPSDIGTIELDWNTVDTIATYTVTWQFDWMGEGQG